MFNKNNPQPGIYNISNEDYHSSAGLSRSALCELKRSPYHFWHRHLSGEYEHEEKEAFIFGESIHTLVLEPHEFEGKFFASTEKYDRRTKEGKYLHEMMLQEAGDRKLISYDKYKSLQLMRQSIHRHPQALPILSGGEIEQSIYWIDPNTGFLCKVRPDIYHNHMAADLKSCDSATPWAFSKAIYDKYYYIQAGMIAEAFKHVFNVDLKDFLFVCVEKKAPYAVAVYPLDETAIQKGRSDFKSLLFKYRDCLEKNEWPMYETQVITLPTYAMYE